MSKILKLERLTNCQSKQRELRPEGLERWVVNLTDRALTPAQEEVLKLRLNFAPAPSKLPLTDTMAAVESGARRLSPEDADDLRRRVCGILRQVKVPRSNLTREHRTALKEFKGLKDEVILPADKGNATVIMRRCDYDGKMEEMLGTGTYGKLRGDPTATQENRLSRKLKGLEKKGEITSGLYNRLRPTGSQPPRIYSLPKIHKPDVPLRPIVSCIGSPTYQLSKYITSLISPLAGHTSSHVKNSRYFTELIGSMHVESDEILVSFDVSSLFTNIPVDEAISVIRRKLEEDGTLGDRTFLSPERIAELLGMCLKSTYFSYGGSFYEQKEGAVMGSPVSAVVANLYMEFFEELALETAPTRPRLWKRYVDDTFCILRKGSTEELLHHLNRVRPTIKFTVEQEEDGTLPFLDTLPWTSLSTGSPRTRTGIFTLSPIIRPT